MKRKKPQPQHRHTHPLLAFIGLALLLTALYGVGLRFPFYSDDARVFNYIRSADFGQMWLEPDVFGTYYRPLVYTIFYARWEAWAFYALTLFTHLLNTALLLRLLRSLRLSTQVQIAGAIAFGCFAFSAQAILWVAAYGHLLGLTLLLVTAIATLHALDRGQRHSFMLALLAGCATSFAHENGILTLPLVGLLLLYRYGWRGCLTRWREGLLLGVPIGLAGLAFWFIRAHLLGGGLSNDGLYLTQNLALALQWLTYPMQWLGGMVGGYGEMAVSVGAGALLLLAVLPLLWRRRYGRVFLLGLLLASLAALPATLLLHPAYFAWGERLLYWSGLGLALSYGVSLGAMPRLLRYGAVGLLIVSSLTIVLPYRQDMERHNVMAQDLFAQAAQLEADDSLLVVDLIAQTERSQPLLPLTPTRAFMFSDWVTLDAYLRVNGVQPLAGVTSVRGRSRQVTWPDERHNTEIFRHGQMRDRPTLTAEIAAHDLTLWVVDDESQDYDDPRLRPIVERLDTPLDEALPIFSETLALAAQAHIDNEMVTVQLDWTKLGQTENFPFVAFVHLLCDGAIVAQSDAAPAFNALPFAEMQAGEAWRDWRYLYWRGEPCPQPQVRVGLYDPATGIRLPVPLADDPDAEWLLLPVTDIR